MIVADICEVDSGKRTDREQLLKAIEFCRKTGAKLICSKLDRIARNTRLYLTLRDSGIQMVCCDLPDAGPFSNFIQNLLAGTIERLADVFHPVGTGRVPGEEGKQEA